ncbi:DUF6049 family protein [Salinibacterium hongtaonis]|uniref:DUF6049 family protein n=1 Tax=Homoserinimonas hongtaonis TaxID=2079791 RepID=UPI0011B24435|nr:DUF6049 family protein [Salinibacterium hongtaonis]
MPLTLVARVGAALLSTALALGGTVASPTTPDPGSLAPAATNGLPTSLALAATITVPEQTTELISPENLEAYTQPNGVLNRQLDAFYGQPVALGIDPMILASIRILGTSAPASAVSWLERLEGAPNETFSLAYADADVATLAQAGLGSITVPTDFTVDPNLFPEAPAPSESATAGPDETVSPTIAPGNEDDSGSEETEPESMVPTGEQLVDLPFTLAAMMWPRESTVITTDLPVFNAAGPVTTILDSTNVSYVRDAIPASARIGDSGALVATSDISALLREAGSAGSDAAWVAAMAELTAALAGWTAGDSTVLATFGRDIPFSTNRIPATIAALTATPGIVVTSLAATMDEAAVDASIVDQPVSADRVALVAGMLATEPAIAQFSSILETPSLITGERRRTLLALASTAWVDSTSDWPAEVSAYVDGSTEILESVQVLESSTINLLSETGDLPVTVSNALPYPVTVYVTVTSNTAILDVLEGRVAVTVEGGSQSRAAIPVQSIANGTASLVVTLSSVTNVPISSPTYMTTNVQAGWDTAFTTIVAVLVLLMFIGGIIRTVRRRRRLKAEAAAQSIAGPAA